MLDDKRQSSADGVFLPGEELWDPNFRRLTMTFDPGRIKRGLTSNEAMGPPIAEGKRYTLVIDRDWPDARGVPMVEGFRKTFRGGPAERNPPDPKQWTSHRAQSGHVGCAGGGFPDADELSAAAEDASGFGHAQGSVAGTVSIAARKPNGASRRGSRGSRAITNWSWTPRSKTSPAITSASPSTSTSSSTSPNTSPRIRFHCRSPFASRPRQSHRRINY